MPGLELAARDLARGVLTDPQLQRILGNHDRYEQLLQQYERHECERDKDYVCQPASSGRSNLCPQGRDGQLATSGTPSATNSSGTVAARDNSGRTARGA